MGLDFRWRSIPEVHLGQKVCTIKFHPANQRLGVSVREEEKVDKQLASLNISKTKSLTVLEIGNNVNAFNRKATANSLPEFNSHT